ncbi:Aryl hydrocarbon receptor nuclear translocator [Hypsibius exemplaris]|uniref:Aryl hydrocarbon receptor nuclear translocator homolog n=1 Tax=Hypsibius exemplaris TaxID=2072580 RepID=A0A1W0X6M6_HYPEX|nr:Aryl hydrocarbon receptor nuclear translocator [Hypsibius exemplaris]
MEWDMGHVESAGAAPYDGRGGGMASNNMGYAGYQMSSDGLPDGYSSADRNLGDFHSPGKYPRMEDVESIQDKERYARENHSEIERRRRNKMTAYITELSDMVPTCNALARKPDKLTILRMAVGHMKTLRGTGNTSAEYKPAFLTDQELKHLILEAADGFLFIVACDPQAHICYLSDSTTAVLNQPHTGWVGESFYDLIHPDDVEKVREQLQGQESQSSGRILDLKTGTIKKEGHQSSMRVQMGSKRAFICRMRVGNTHPDPMFMGTGRHLVRMRHRASLGPSPDGQQYVVVHCSGYVKNWNGPGAQSREQPNDSDEPSTSSGQGGNWVMVAIGRLQMTSIPNTSDLDEAMPFEFVTRHAADGSTLFVDQRISAILQYAPTEFLGKPLLDMVHPEDHKEMTECFEIALKSKGQTTQKIARFRSKNGDYEVMRSVMYAFLNPYSEELEFVISTHTLVKAIQQQEGISGQPVSGLGPAMQHTLQPADHAALAYNRLEPNNSASAPAHASGSRSKQSQSSYNALPAAHQPSMARSSSSHSSSYGQSSSGLVGQSRSSSSSYVPSTSYQPAESTYTGSVPQSSWSVGGGARSYEAVEVPYPQAGHVSAYPNPPSLYSSPATSAFPMPAGGRPYSALWPGQQQMWSGGGGGLPGTSDNHNHSSPATGSSGQPHHHSGEEMADYYRSSMYDHSNMPDMTGGGTYTDHYPE